MNRRGFLLAVCASPVAALPVKAEQPLGFYRAHSNLVTVVPTEFGKEVFRLTDYEYREMVWIGEQARKRRLEKNPNCEREEAARIIERAFRSDDG